MSFASRIVGYLSGRGAEVDLNNYLQANPPLIESQAGFAALSSEVDAGDVTGTRLSRALELSRDYKLRVALDTLAFDEKFPGAAFNSAIWAPIVTTMTATVANGFATLNAGLSVASGAVARLTSYRSFPCYGTVPVYFEDYVQFAQLPVANNVCEWGSFIATGTTAPTDGPGFFRLLANGEFRCIANANGVEIQSAPLDFANIVGMNLSHDFVVSAGPESTSFWIDDILVARLELPVAGYAMSASNNCPVNFRIYNSGATGSAQVMKIGQVNVTFADLNHSKPYPHIIAGASGGAYQGQTGGTMGTTALYSNSLAAGAGAVMTNTTAALGAGLGGQFTAQPTLAAGTDGIVCSYQVPAGTPAIPGKTLYVCGVRVQAIVSAALTGGPCAFAYSAAFGHTSLSMATAEAAGTKAPRRVPIGCEGLAAAAAAGTLGSQNGANVQFATPLIVQPGEFFAICAKNLGTVTSAGTVTFLVTVDGYFE